jgi:serine/threonine protein kinase
MSVDHLVGQSLGQYELRALLGAGGMGAVYRAYQRSLKREVAVKVLIRSLANQPDYVHRFTREAETAARLEHPHIVSVYDYGVEGDVCYVAMRLLNGGSLQDRIYLRSSEATSGLPSLGEVGDLLRQIASALDYAHSQGVIHRDIKASNIMFDHQGNAYLVDFGIAKLVNATSALTGTGAAMGTPSYMPPEQWRGDELTPAVDQYALGVTIYAMLTGKLPFEANTPFGLMHKHLNEQPTPPQHLRPSVPSAVALVLERALAKSASARFPTVTAFAQAFESAVEGTKGETTGFFTFQVESYAERTRKNQAQRPAPMDDVATIRDSMQDTPTEQTPSPTPAPPQPVVASPLPPKGLTTHIKQRRTPPLMPIAAALLVIVVLVGASLLALSRFSPNTVTTPTSAESAARLTLQAAATEYAAANPATPTAALPAEDSARLTLQAAATEYAATANAPTVTSAARFTLEAAATQYAAANATPAPPDLDAAATAVAGTSQASMGGLLVIAPGTFQDELGCAGDWMPDCTSTQLIDENGDGIYFLNISGLNAGDYQFKIAVGGSWDENYGANGEPEGQDIPFTARGGDVIIRYNHRTHEITVAALPPEGMAIGSVMVVAVGTFQEEFGCAGDWTPACPDSQMTDDNNDGIYLIALRDLPNGDYELRVAIGGSWSEHYGANSSQGGANIPFSVGGGDVIVRYNRRTHEITVAALAP